MCLRELEEIPYFFGKIFLLNIYVHQCIYKFSQTDKVVFSNTKVVFSNSFERIVLTEKCKSD